MKLNLKFYLDILIQHKDIQFLFSPIFLTVYICLLLSFDNFWTVHSSGHKKFKSVEIFKLSFRVSEIEALIFIYF
jgi:hypothetical protein